MTLQEYVAQELLKAWFAKRWNDESWRKSNDGASWIEISLLDAEVAIKAYESYYDDDMK